MHDSGESTTDRRNRIAKFSSEKLTIVPVPREELPDEMRSVLESVCPDYHPQNSLDRYLDSFVGQFISSRRPSLADLRSVRPEAQRANTGVRSQSQGSSTEGYERYDYDGRNDYRINGPNSVFPFNSALKRKKIPSRVYHTHKVVPRSRPNAKEQIGKRRWYPSKRHGRVIRQEDYDAFATNELGQRARRFPNSESLLNLSTRSARTARESIGKAVGGGRLWRWPCGLKSKLGEVTKYIFRRG